MIVRIIKKIFIYFFWASIVLSIFLTIILFFGAKPVGVLEARWDLWRGRYELHGYGLFLGEPYGFKELKQYGIEYRLVAGCVVNGFIIDNVAAYNATMISAIRKDLQIDIDQNLSVSSLDKSDN